MTGEVSRKVTAPASLIRAGSHEDRIRVCLCGGFCPQGLGERNAVTETAVCSQEGPSSSVAQGIPCQGSLCLCRVSLALQAQQSGH